MPMYLNSSAVRVTLGSYILEPGESKVIGIYFPTLPTGVTKTDDSGSFNPVIYSAALSASGTYTIPASVTGNYSISLYSATGESTVKFNSSSNTAYVIAEGLGVSKFCPERLVDSIIYTVASGGVLYLTIEKS